MRPPPGSLLRLLADGRYRLPDELAHALGAGRADVLDALRRLEAAGAMLEPGAEGAVRLPEPLDLIDGNAARAALRKAGVPVSLDVVDECTSTNAVMMQRATEGAASGSALACELQTAGRGRRGTAWVAPPGGALAMSLLWRMPTSGTALAGLSLAAGVACMRALRRCGVPGAALKWPNDIVQGGRKLGGILIETGPDAAGTAAVCGIGLNTRLSPVARAAIAQPVTDIASLAARPPTRTVLLVALLTELADAMRRFAAAGFGAFRDEWLRHHAHQDQAVTVLLADERRIAGRALGIAEDGALLVEHGGRVERFHSGEVSLRAA